MWTRYDSWNMKGGWILNRLKNRIKDRVVRSLARTDEPHTEPYRKIRASLSELSWQEQESLFLELKKQLAGNKETIAYAEKMFLIYSGYLRKFGSSLNGIRILEIGPGNNLGAGMHFLLAGAGQYTAIDALSSFPERPVEFYTNLMEEIQMRPQLVGRSSLDKGELQNILAIDGRLRWNPDRLQYLSPVYAEKMPFEENQFDYVYSNASFEHFEQPEKVIREVFRVLKPEGVTAHTIDLRDHADFNKPREFLKVSPQDYRYASPYETNRWRASEFEKAFRAAGFTIREFCVNERKEISEQEFAGLDAFFRNNYSRDDLEILGITVLAKK